MDLHLLLAPLLTACPWCPAVAPLVVLEPNEQRYVWGVAVRIAPVGKVCHFRTPAISVSGGFSDETAETASVPSGLFRGRRWAGAVAALGWGMIPADLWPRGQVTHALPWGATFRGRGGAVSGPKSS